MSDDKDKQLRQEIKNRANLITEVEQHRITSARFNEMGLCSRCQNLLAIRTQYGTVYAKCEFFTTKLNHADPVTDCTKFWENSLYSMDDFLRMATMIDTKRKIGFGSEEDFE